MRKNIVLFAAVCLFSMAVAVSANETATDFSGDWKLDLDKSELGERSRVESMTMKVTQSETELTYKREAKRSEGGGGRRGFRGGGNPAPVTYKLDGTETSADIGRGDFTGKATYKAEKKDEKLVLSATRTFETPNGTRSNKSFETWELSEDGKTLTITTDRDTRRGLTTTKMVFSKV
jgi:hypothetical protein